MPVILKLDPLTPELDPLIPELRGLNGRFTAFAQFAKIG